MKPYFEEDGITIYHGDCREILPSLPPVDLVLTDPPYGIGANKMTLGNGKQRIYRGERDWDKAPIDIGHLLRFENIAIWGGNYFHLPPSRCWFVWDKGTGENDFADCELCWTTRNAVVKKFTRSWVGQNAKEYNQPRTHPTQKPVELMRWCLKFWPNAYKVLDPYAGTGATLIAAKDLGRKAIGIEIEEKYCEIAAKRLSQGVLSFE